MKNNVYKNVLVIVVGLSVFYYLFDEIILLYSILVLGVLSVFSDKFAILLNFVWMRFAMALGWINSRILLTIVFYIFLFPLAILSRLFTKDPLRLKAPEGSNFINRDYLFKKSDIKNIW
ncbi:MAG: SxtJ family membrane protein [Cyclobacteriaceae bacterium]|nr:SxtJ family membrane protein [Cyclobacteriaceae bacterium]